MASDYLQFTKAASKVSSWPNRKDLRPNPWVIALGITAAVLIAVFPPAGLVAVAGGVAGACITAAAAGVVGWPLLKVGAKVAAKLVLTPVALAFDIVAAPFKLVKDGFSFIAKRIRGKPVEPEIEMPEVQAAAQPADPAAAAQPRARRGSVNDPAVAPEDGEPAIASNLAFEAYLQILKNNGNISPYLTENPDQNDPAKIVSATIELDSTDLVDKTSRSFTVSQVEGKTVFKLDLPETGVNAADRKNLLEQMCRAAIDNELPGYTFQVDPSMGTAAERAELNAILAAVRAEKEAQAQLVAAPVASAIAASVAAPLAAPAMPTPPNGLPMPPPGRAVPPPPLGRGAAPADDPEPLFSVSNGLEEPEKVLGEEVEDIYEEEPEEVLGEEVEDIYEEEPEEVLGEEVEDIYEEEPEEVLGEEVEDIYEEEPEEVLAEEQAATPVYRMSAEENQASRMDFLNRKKDFLESLRSNFVDLEAKKEEYVKLYNELADGNITGSWARHELSAKQRELDELYKYIEGAASLENQIKENAEAIENAIADPIVEQAEQEQEAVSEANPKIEESETARELKEQLEELKKFNPILDQAKELREKILVQSTGLNYMVEHYKDYTQTQVQTEIEKLEKMEKESAYILSMADDIAEVQRKLELELYIEGLHFEPIQAEDVRSTSNILHTANTGKKSEETPALQERLRARLENAQDSEKNVLEALVNAANILPKKTVLSSVESIRQEAGIQDDFSSKVQDAQSAPRSQPEPEPTPAVIEPAGVEINPDVQLENVAAAELKLSLDKRTRSSLTKELEELKAATPISSQEFHEKNIHPKQQAIPFEKNQKQKKILEQEVVQAQKDIVPIRERGERIEQINRELKIRDAKPSPNLDVSSDEARLDELQGLVLEPEILNRNIEQQQKKVNSENKKRFNNAAKEQAQKDLDALLTEKLVNDARHIEMDALQNRIDSNAAIGAPKLVLTEKEQIENKAAAAVVSEQLKEVEQAAQTVHAAQIKTNIERQEEENKKAQTQEKVDGPSLVTATAAGAVVATAATAEEARRKAEEMAAKEKERLDKEKADKERADKEEQERLKEIERLAAEALALKAREEKERLEKEEKERLEKERLEKEEKERLEKERLEKEKVDMQAELEKLKEQLLEAQKELKDAPELNAFTVVDLQEKIKKVEAELAANLEASAKLAEKAEPVAGQAEVVPKGPQAPEESKAPAVAPKAPPPRQHNRPLNTPLNAPPPLPPREPGSPPALAPAAPLPSGALAKAPEPQSKMYPEPQITAADDAAASAALGADSQKPLPMPMTMTLFSSSKAATPPLKALARSNAPLGLGTSSDVEEENARGHTPRLGG